VSPAGEAADKSLEIDAYVRRLHELIERASLSSRSTGHEPYRRVQIYR